MGTLVAHTNIQGTGSTRVSSAIDTTGANLLVGAYIQDWLGACAFTDNQGNTWATGGSSITDAGGLTKGGISYVINPTTSASHTFSLSGSNSNQSSIVYAFKTALAFDTANVGNDIASTTTITTNSLTPANATNLIVAILGKVGDGGTASINQGFLNPEDVPTILSQQWGLGFAYLFQAAATARQPTWTTTLTNTYLTAELMSFSMSADASGFVRGYVYG